MKIEISGKKIIEIRLYQESQEDWEKITRLNGRKMEVIVFENTRNCVIREQG
ncbi:hypothetical protein KAI52_02845 [Candidatus Parcubacteria bacterium]|nr:hypothetical protein [Candidatus Parcubacteria bacterium]